MFYDFFWISCSILEYLFCVYMFLCGKYLHDVVYLEIYTHERGCTPIWYSNFSKSTLLSFWLFGGFEKNLTMSACLIYCFFLHSFWMEFCWNHVFLDEPFDSYLWQWLRHKLWFLFLSYRACDPICYLFDIFFESCVLGIHAKQYASISLKTMRMRYAHHFISLIKCFAMSHTLILWLSPFLCCLSSCCSIVCLLQVLCFIVYLCFLAHIVCLKWLWG